MVATHEPEAGHKSADHETTSPRSRKYSTKHACNACRKKRTKCNGQTPCQRCRLHDCPCTYVQNTQQSKSSLRRELEALRKTLQDSTDIISALRYSPQSSQVLGSLQSGQTNRQILDMLGTFEPDDSVLDQVPPDTTDVVSAGETPESSNGEFTSSADDGGSGGGRHVAFVEAVAGAAYTGGVWDGWYAMNTAQPIYPEDARLPEHAMLTSSDPCLCVWCA